MALEDATSGIDIASPTNGLSSQRLVIITVVRDVIIVSSAQTQHESFKVAFCALPSLPSK